MANKKKTSDKVNNVAPQTQEQTVAERNNSWRSLFGGAIKDNAVMDGILSFFDKNLSAFSANNAPLQNKRIKEILSSPRKYDKNAIAEFLNNPEESESLLRAVAHWLSLANYPFYKIVKTYADIPTYKHYTKPLYLTDGDAKKDDFLREAVLLDKFDKALRPEIIAHKIVGQAVKSGKVFYTPRYEVDKSHNAVKYAFLQQLPEDWCTIVGHNNISGYTVSFNMMYFMQLGTDPKQYGDLFDPFLDDFNAMFADPRNREKTYYKPVYSAFKGEKSVEIDCKGTKLTFYPDRVKSNATGNPRVDWTQDGQYMYYVTLPIERVWTFEIDDTHPDVVSALSGLIMTYAQQGDFEQAQLANVINPLMMLLTGEIDFFSDNGTTKEDDYRLSIGGRKLFEALFYQMLQNTNTSGIGFYTAPVKNIKSHTFPESANANEIAQKYNVYASGKSGLASLIPVAEDIKAGQVQSSERLESAYPNVVLRQFERMVDYIYRDLNLRYEWAFKFIGDIYHETELRDNAMKAIANGDISAHFILCALDGESWVEKMSMMRVINENGMLDMLIPPITSYTMKQDTNGGLPPQAGRPKSDGELTEGKEKAIDAGYTS